MHQSGPDPRPFSEDRLELERTLRRQRQRLRDLQKLVEKQRHVVDVETVRLSRLEELVSRAQFDHELTSKFLTSTGADDYSRYALELAAVTM